MRAMPTLGRTVVYTDRDTGSAHAAIVSGIVKLPPDQVAPCAPGSVHPEHGYLLDLHVFVPPRGEKRRSSRKHFFPYDCVLQETGVEFTHHPAGSTEARGGWCWPEESW